MYALYAAIPETDINGAELRRKCSILDDGLAKNSDKVTGLAEDIPLYIDTLSLAGMSDTKQQPSNNA